MTEVLVLLLSFPKDLKASKLIRAIAVVLPLGFLLLLPFFYSFFLLECDKSLFVTRMEDASLIYQTLQVADLDLENNSIWILKHNI